MDLLKEQFDIPVTLFVFKRLETVKLIMDIIRKVKPNKFYVFADGAREGKGEEDKIKEVRDYIDQAVDWECEFHKEYSEKNISCTPNIVRGFNQVLKENSYGIFFEDDAVPKIEYFYYCQELLRKYEKDKQIEFIAGFNAIGDRDIITDSYSFGKTVPMSGAIAIWSDRWLSQDIILKGWNNAENRKKVKKSIVNIEFRNRVVTSYKHINKMEYGEWDEVLNYNLLVNDRLAIVPKGNLVRSFGYTEGAFHEQEKFVVERLKKLMDFTQYDDIIPLKHPEKVKWDKEYDRVRQEVILSVRGNWLQRRCRDLFLWVKEVCYKIMPKRMWNWLKILIKG